MSDWVMDCSIALAISLEDEDTAFASAFLERIADGDRLWIPALFWSELGNGLEMARRRGRISFADVDASISAFRDLPLMTDYLLGPEATLRHRQLAGEEDLTAYDAAYLELARRRRLGLATLDTRLAEAAGRSGVNVFQAG